jgi:hypothetical protein
MPVVYIFSAPKTNRSGAAGRVALAAAPRIIGYSAKLIAAAEIESPNLPTPMVLLRLPRRPTEGKCAGAKYAAVGRM